MMAFFAAHMINHLVIYLGSEAHLAFMETLRAVYRFPLVELLLIWAILRQILAGIRQLKRFGIKSKGRFTVLVYSGLYLIFFLALHLSAIGIARYVQGVDTNLYFALAGYRTSAALLVVPYYAVAIFAAFAHMGAVIWLRTRAARPKFANVTYHAGVYGGIAMALILSLGLSGLAVPFEIPQLYRWS